MAEFDTDLFVIGGGSGGVRAARIAAGYGARVMLAEEYRVGGTCVIRGCVPKKLLVYASRFGHEFEDAAGYGWTVAETSFHWPTLIANKDKEIARLEAAYTANLTRANVTIEKSRAVLDDAHTVRLLADGRQRARQAHPDRDRRLARHGHRHRGHRACDLVERGVPPDRAAEAHPDPGRRLHRGRVRLHLRRVGLAGDAGLSRREHPARLRRRRARASARRDGAERHQGHLQAYRRGGREGRSRPVRGIVRP